MKIIYLVAGAFLDWVIRTDEGKEFTNAMINKGYSMIKEKLSDSKSASKSNKESCYNGKNKETN